MKTGIVIISLLLSSSLIAQPDWTLMSSGTTKDINAIWGSSPYNIYAVGDTGLILHYDGNTWQPMSSGISNNINGIIGFSANEIYAVAGRVFSGITLPGRILKFDGNSWSILISNLLFAGNSIWGTSGSDLWVDGNDSKIYHYNGIQWEGQVTFFGFSPLLSIHGISATEVYAGGNEWFYLSS